VELLYIVAGSLVILSGAVMHFLENRKPLHEVDRKKQFRFDLAVIFATAFVVAAIMQFLVTDSVTSALHSSIGLGSSILALPFWARLTLALIVGDLGYYVVHRAMHLNWLWPMHRFHHSTIELYWFSGLRTSMANSLVIRIPYLFALHAFEIPAEGILVTGIMLLIVNFWVHANFEVRLGPLEWLVITPSFHRVHHVTAGELEGHNFGNILSVWDHIFGSAVFPNEIENKLEKGFEVPADEVARQLIGV
jgi:sterol desaturase/sphingolipid hydroxylase (fatty acid hydroxylase superfamily)